MCLSLFLQCSRFYLRGKRYQKHLIANEYAALICLQVKAVQIHLAASLQEQQSAQRALEQEQREKQQEYDLGLNFPALGIGVGLQQWDPNAPDFLPFPVAKPVEEPAIATVPIAIVDAEPVPGDEGQVQVIDAEPVPGEEPPSAGVAAPSPFGAPVPADGVEGPTPAENAFAPTEGAASVGQPYDDDDDYEQPLAPALEATSGGPLTLGPAGDIFVVVNLEMKEVEVFVEYHHDFVVAFQVTSAYSHRYGESLLKVWPRALYRQVVLLGNFGYLQHFMLHQHLTKEYLETTVPLYLNEVCPEQFPSRAQRMRQFLRDGVRNLEVRYQLARQLGADFADISMETASLMYMA